MNHIPHLVKNKFVLMWHLSDEQKSKSHVVNFFWCIKSGFDEFVLRTMLPRLITSWSVDLRIFFSNASIRIVDLFEESVFLTIDRKFPEFIHFCRNFPYVGLIFRQQTPHLWRVFYYNTVFSKLFSLRRDFHERLLLLCLSVAFHYLIFSGENSRLLFSHHLRISYGRQKMTGQGLFGALSYQSVWAGWW